MAIVSIDRIGDLADGLVERFVASGGDPKRLTIIDPLDPEWTTPWNPFAAEGDPNTIAGGFTSAVRLRSSGWGVQIEESVRCCSQALIEAKYSPLEFDALFTNPGFRALVVSKITDPYLKGYFNRLDALTAEQRSQWHLAVSNKLAPFLSYPQLRRILCGKGGLSLRQLLDDPAAVLLVSLRCDRLHDAGDLLGELLVRALWNAALSRADIPEKQRSPSLLILDEFQNFASGCICEIIAEGRRFAVKLVIAHQSQAQIDAMTRAVLRNNAAVRLIFSPGPVDAEELSRELSPMSRPEAYASLLALQTGEAYAIRRGHKAVRVITPNPPASQIPKQRLDEVRSQAMQLHGQPVKVVDEDIATRMADIEAMAGERPRTQKEVHHVRRPGTQFDD